ncbi:ABC transporter substrate-binding protein [Bosea sp. (in: a-proteobacteria)]|uniref:ABC transporter substrate-binding protein n=1 Tax=Bosea sp. (in: a-proteobacteria) TaxID=1871050 RepID=UPI002614E731|nr:ABC transporter substrate-binding protein [Bosea sp. (in: a-proteobacteria)]MCO5089661.1 ABC transporter substrate-binding protein [Bosea sp. (in: a-proteobacteria)]
MTIKLTRREGLVAAAGLMGSAVLPAYGQTASGITDKEIKLGGVFAVSGPVRLVTEPYEQAIRAYFNRVNEQGGINGRKINWLVEDDAYQPARTLAGAKKLVERDGVFLLFGAMGTPTTLAVAPYADQVKVPFFTVNASPEPPRKYTFGLMANYSDVMYYVARQLSKEMGFKKIGYLYQNDDLGEVGRIGIERAFKELGVSFAADVGYERGTTDFSTHVLKLRDAGVDAVISMGVAPSTATAVKQAAGANYTPTWATFSVGSSAPMLKLLGPAINGMVFGSEIETQFSDSEAAQDLAALMKQYFPQTALDWGAMVGYVHAKVIVAALKAAGASPTRESVLATLENTKNFEAGLMAPVSYGPNKRTGANGIRVYQWKGDKPVALTDWLPIGAAK